MGRQDIVTIIKGGGGTVTGDANLVLDGRETNDPDGFTNSFLWTCEEYAYKSTSVGAVLPSAYKGCDFIVPVTGQTLTIPDFRLQLRGNGAFRFVSPSLFLSSFR